jgi:SPASM domain peptide maturase of grasp-with-spasm system
MVLILSENNDLTTDKVIEWLNYWEVKDIIRINEDDKIIIKEIDIQKETIILKFNDNDINVSDVDFFWFRRGNLNHFVDKQIEWENSDLDNQVHDFLKYEWLMCRNYIFQYLQQKKSLGNFFRSATNKLINLRIARECGWDIPKTLISEYISALTEFQTQFPVITKPIGEVMPIRRGNEHYKMLTTNVKTDQNINRHLAYICPVLFQERIEKQFEIRAFVMYEKIYAMAIFSQKNTKTNNLQRKEYHLTPNFLYDILYLCKENSIRKIKEEYDEKSCRIIDNCFQYLFDKELAFPCTCEDLSFFPDMSIEYEVPCLLENFILDINAESNHDFQKIINSLSQITLKAFQIRFFHEVNIDFLDKIMRLICTSNIQTVELIVPHNENVTWNDWLKLTQENLKLTNITIYQSAKFDIRYHKQATIVQTKESVASSTDCGKISKDLFSCNQNLYIESQSYNTCLNRKASIATHGEIKNCPSMQTSFGNYKEVSLLEVVKTSEFQKLWKIKKDDIEVCKDCEFRHMCADCRAFIKDSSNIYSQPAKCTYNPYIAKWEGEDGYYSVEEWIQKNK